MSKTQKKINKLSRRGVSDWSKDADYRIKNRKWLRYSSHIARRILAAIEDRQKVDSKINQSHLANIIGVTPQYISRVVKGKENLSLETIGKLSDALGVELIAFPDYKDSRPIPANKIIKRNIHIDSEAYVDIDAESYQKVVDIISNCQYRNDVQMLISTLKNTSEVKVKTKEADQEISFF